MAAMPNAFCECLGLDIPIVQAPMAGAGGPQLAAAVSNAGALGMLALWHYSIEQVRDEICATRTLTARPFGVNLNLNWPQDERLDACLEEGVKAISLFWGEAPREMVDRAHKAGALVLYSAGSAAQAKRGAECGADAIVAQGWESGGHVWGSVATLALVPAVVDAVHPLPVIAAGGIADGRGLAAVFALGACGAWIGTRFLLSPEARVHPRYQALLIAASEDATEHTDDLYDVGWPKAPHRALRNKTFDNWVAAGRPATGRRPGEGEVIAKSGAGADVVRYRSYTAGAGTTGDIDALSLWAGQGVGLVTRVKPAGEIVREISADAATILDRLNGHSLRAQR
jgi:NAD(P)H-dependent flavin oxidoreductase YrpB (nitropropane dioxygenase family)